MDRVSRMWATPRLPAVAGPATVGRMTVAFDQGTARDPFARQRPIPDNLIGDLTGVNAFVADVIASSVVERHAPWAWDRAERLGDRVWDPRVLKLARDAERHLPELRILDRLGDEVHDVDFHPGYH